MTRDRTTAQPAVRRNRAPRWPLIAAIVVPAIIGLLIVLFVVPRTDQPVVRVNDPLSEPTEPPSPASAAEVQVIHNALHDIGARCRNASTPPETIDADVDAILAFSERYPVGRFPIDDETGNAVSLLLLTREALQDCAPDASARVDLQLPTELRRG